MNPAAGSLREKTIKSLFWQFLGVGGQRIVQLASPIVLWRVLDKVDLGLFAIVLSGIGVVESLTTFLGEQTSIWSDRGAERRYLDTVFTVRLLRSILISSLLCGLAWPFAWFFAEPDTEARYWLPGLFLVLAANGLVDAVQSPARAASMKGLQFRRVALWDFVASVLGIGLTLVLAVLWTNVWALVVGYISSTAMRTLMSYLAAPHRPRFRLDREVVRELLHYNAGAAGTPFLLLMIFTAHAFVIGKVVGKGAVAVFDGAGRLAKLPEDLFLRVLAPVAIPAYAQLKGDIPRLGRAWVNAVRAFLLVGTPLTVSLAWCGDSLPAFVFGAKYVPIPGLFALLAFHGGLAGLTSVVGPLFWAVGHPKWDRRAQFFRCLAIYGVGIPAVLSFGVTGFAAATCMAVAVALLLSLAYALRYLNLRWSDLTHSARDGLVIGALLLSCMLLVDLLWAPTHILRIVIAGAVGGPLTGLLMLQLLRERQVGTPSDLGQIPVEPTL